MATLHYSTPGLLAAAAGIVGSTWTAGNISSVSLIGIPAIRHLPNAAQVWYRLFAAGKALAPKIVITTAIFYTYAAYASRNRGGRTWGSYIGAAGLVLGTIPFTLTVMGSTNGSLIQAATASAVVSSEGVVDELIMKWRILNLVRSLLPLAGALTGLVTLLKGTILV